MPGCFVRRKSPAAIVPAVKPVVVPPVRVPAKPRIDAALMAQYRDALQWYAGQVKNNAPLEDQRSTLERIIEKYDGKMDVSSIKAELKKLKKELEVL